MIVDREATIVVRFDHGIEECERPSLSRELGVAEAFREPTLPAPLEVINRLQAQAIRSANDAWGVFSRSRIELLPHQLWVCRRVIAEWPTRWLIADDVGLGKTIEAGMILWPLLSSGRVQRLLILVPAHLVEQWQYRLRTMFDIRVKRYIPEEDTQKGDFWGSHRFVVASLQTLRMDQKDRWRRLIESGAWDLVVVDEAHHLNSDEESGPTLGYSLIRKLNSLELIRSMLFFTGTPHRGKNFGFLSLMNLLRPDLFDPKKPLSLQLPKLSQAMIRNNKSKVTDLQGRRIFQKPEVSSEVYRYSAAEKAFYELLSEFIVEGRAYASSLESSQGRAVMLVLVAMQKLASSSIAAIARAIERRLERIEHRQAEVQDLKARVEEYQKAEQEGAADDLSRLEEELAAASSDLRLMADEEPRLRELLSRANAIERETKLDGIVDVVSRRFAGRSVLFFTEYKATQSRLMTYLMERFGEDSVTFINGDERLDAVHFPNGDCRSVTSRREDAAAAFNAGQRRFLISTEAAGEGVDLQESCYTLVHVDLPWNPMRLHQRVGRLNRYGQKHRVEVLMIRNPETVESLIWERLEEKLTRITQAFGHVMDEPEDLMELVLGTASQSTFLELFKDAPFVRQEKLTEWFDQKTATFGGRDAVEIVKGLVGHAAKFDFKSASPALPRVDLPDLRPFLDSALALRNRRVKYDEHHRMSFRTPEEWRDRPGLQADYSGMRLDRSGGSSAETAKILGVGHKLFDRALEDALQRSAVAATLPKDVLQSPLIVFIVRDRVTEGEAPHAPRVAAVAPDLGSRDHHILKDWELLKLLNELPLRRHLMREPSASGPDPDAVQRSIDSASAALTSALGTLDIEYRHPETECVGVLWPTDVR